MPKETVHWGWAYAKVTVPPTKDQGGYFYPLDRDLAVQAVQRGEIDATNVEHTHSPQLELHWSRAADTPPTPLGEDRVGSVQLAIQVSETEFRDYIRMFEEAPKDDPNRLFLTRRMSRSEINHLIRHLKRARDAAYGADE